MIDRIPTNERNLRSLGNSGVLRLGPEVLAITTVTGQPAAQRYKPFMSLCLIICTPTAWAVYG
jgi:hypothetical protein